MLSVAEEIQPASNCFCLFYVLQQPFGWWSSLSVKLRGLGSLGIIRQLGFIPDRSQKWARKCQTTLQPHCPKSDQK